MKRWIIVSLLLTASATVASGANWLANADFEADAIITGSQTLVGADQWKRMDAALNDQITGIQDWVSKQPGDQGLSREVDAGGSLSQQMAFINNWGRRISQTVTQTVQAGVTYRAEIDYCHNSNMTTEGKCGIFQLIAGGVNPADTDALEAGAIILDEYKIGNSLHRDSGTFDEIVEQAYEWRRIRVQYTAAAGDPAIGKPLTVSFITEWWSGGPNLWDNATLEDVILLSDPPVADATVSPDTYTIGDFCGQAVTLDGSGSTDDVGITNYTWRLGGQVLADGATEVTPTVTLPVGVNTVTLTVTDDDLQTDSADVVVTVNTTATPPIADATATPTGTPVSPLPPGLITLDGSNSVPGTGTITTYRWNQGGTVLAESTSPTVQVPLGPSPDPNGTPITLTVEDDACGVSTSDTVLFIDECTGAPPVGYVNDGTNPFTMTSPYAGYAVNLDGDDAVQFACTTKDNIGIQFPLACPVDLSHSEWTITIRADGTTTQAELGGWLRIYDVNNKRMSYWFDMGVNGWVTTTGTIYTVTDPYGNGFDTGFDPTQIARIELNPAGYFDGGLWTGNWTISVGHLEFSPLPGTPPVADAGTDISGVACTYDGAVVTLDGSGSSDADGEVVAYEWLRGPLAWNQGTLSWARGVTSSPDASATGALPCGDTFTVYLIVYDDDGYPSNPWTPARITVQTLAGPPAPIAIDDPQVEFSIENGDIYGTSRSSFVAPSGDVTLELIDSATIPDPTQMNQFVVDVLGNIYFADWTGDVYSLSPGLSQRWHADVAPWGTAGSMEVIVGSRYVYAMCALGEPSRTAQVVALGKSDGVVAWQTDLGEDASDINNGAQFLMTLHNNVLYALGLPNPFDDDGVSDRTLYAINSDTGAILWSDTFETGAKVCEPGQMALIPDLFATGEHGLMVGNTSWSSDDGLSDYQLIKITPASMTADEVWGFDGADASFGRGIYSDAGDLYGITWGYWGSQLHSFSATADPNGNPTWVAQPTDSYMNVPVSSTTGEVAALSHDGTTVFCGGSTNHVIRYTNDGTGQAFDVENYWFGPADPNDLRCVGPRMIALLNDAGEEYLVTTLQEWQGDVEGERRDITEVVVVNADTANPGGTDADLDDGPIYIDQIEVTYNGSVVMTEDFEGYAEGAFFPQAGPRWSFSGTAGAESKVQIRDTFGAQGKVLELDPFGGSSETVNVNYNLNPVDPNEPNWTGYGDSGQLLTVSWSQSRADLGDIVYIGGTGYGPVATFQGDGREAAYPAGTITGFLTDPGGIDGVSADVVDMGDISAWRDVSFQAHYGVDGVFLEAGPYGGSLSGSGSAGILNDDQYYKGLTIEMTATQASSSYVRVPDAPVASFPIATYTDPSSPTDPYDRTWDIANGMTIAPNGDIYVHRHKRYDHEILRLRLVGQGIPTLCGDANCDGSVDTRDIDAFVAAVTGQEAGWVAYHGGVAPCDYLTANDANGDGNVDTRDIDAFVAAVTGTPCP